MPGQVILIDLRGKKEGKKRLHRTQEEGLVKKGNLKEIDTSVGSFYYLTERLQLRQRG